MGQELMLPQSVSPLWAESGAAASCHCSVIPRASSTQSIPAPRAHGHGTQGLEHSGQVFSHWAMPCR